MHLDFGNLNESDAARVAASVREGQVSTACDGVNHFELMFSNYLGVDSCIATNTGTSSLHLALLACGIGSGDEVIIPALTFIATANVVQYVGATPVVCDVDPHTWNMSVETIERLITDKTKAIIPVHLYGNPCDMTPIMELISIQHDKIWVIEDAAEALGATYKSSMIGTIGDFGCFSLNGNKTITSGAGGVLVSNHKDRLSFAHKLSIPGHNPELCSYNYRMPNICAALASSQLRKLNEFLRIKRYHHELYRQNLNDSFILQRPSPYSNPSWWMTAVRYIGPDQLLHAGGWVFPTRRVFQPLQFTPRFTAFLGESESVYDSGVCLPSSTLNTEEEILQVCETLNQLTTTQQS